MTCRDDQVYIARKWMFIFHFQFTPEYWKLFALEMESLTSEMERMKLKELVWVASLHFFGMKCTALKDWMIENMRTPKEWDLQFVHVN